jgi:hypothetical protein
MYVAAYDLFCAGPTSKAQQQSRKVYGVELEMAAFDARTCASGLCCITFMVRYGQRQASTAAG